MNEQIQNDNFIYIPNFIDTDRARQLANRFINFCQENQLPGDSQIPESHSAYNYVDFLELLCEKTPEVSKFLGETVLPTYTYARVYHNGATLERHRDREACEISLTMHLAGDSDWPIYIQKPNGEEVKLNLASGDAMMYRGNIADHWREEFQGRTYVQVFMHYVRSRGDNNWAYFDKERTKPSKPNLLVDNTPLPKVVEEKTTVKVVDSIKDYIKVFDDIVPHELCDAILKEFSTSTDWRPSYIGQGVIDNTVRNVDTIAISMDSVIGNSTERRRLDNEVFNCASKAINLYNSVFPDARIEQDSGYELLRYNEGQFYVRHTDSFKAQPRAVSCSFALNDDYEGGEWSFWDGDTIIKPKKGSVVMFPSNFMYPHAILPVTKGTRFSIITWFI